MGEGSRAFPLARPTREGDKPDKGTTVRHRISATGAVFPSASVNGQACLVALTPFVPLSREAGEGERAAGRTAVRPYIPLPQAGEGERAIGRTAVRPYPPSPTAWERGWG